MAIKIRRGLDADRLSVVFDQGEIVYTTDTKLVFIGDGVTAGGNPVSSVTYASIVAALGYVPADDAITVKTTGLYANPSWITSLAWGKITGAPPFITTAITSLNGLTGSIQTFANDTNVTIVSAGTTHTLTWSGTLADSRIASSTNWNTAYTNRITSLTTTGSSGSATLVSNTLNIPTYTLAGLGGISYTSLSASTPLSYNNLTGAFSIQQATTSQNGYLSSTDWNTFNGKQDALGFSSIVASGTQVVLTSTSIQSWVVTGSGGQVFKLPDATTLPNGKLYYFNNNQSSGAITVNNNSGTLIASIPSGGYTEITLLSNSIAAGSWERHEQAPSNVSWSTNTFDYPGSITSATWNGVAIADNRIASATNWNTAYTNRITSLTTTGSSGAATLVSNVLNIPNYSLSGLGGQPLNANLTSISALTYASTSFVKMTASGTFALDTNTYLTAESDTLASVTGRGASTTTAVTLAGLTLQGAITGTGNLSNYTVTAASGLAASKRITSTLVASANNDVLVGLDIAPTFTNGAFTGVTNYGLRTLGDVWFNSVASGTLNIYFAADNNSNTNLYARGPLILYSQTAGVFSGSTTATRVYSRTASTPNGVSLGLANTDYLRVMATTGNVLIQNGGTFTDAGFRLDVNGTARIQNQLTTTGSITAASAIARGVYMNQTLVAAANGDTLVGLDINPTFNNGAFTGVTRVPFRAYLDSTTNNYIRYHNNGVNYYHSFEIRNDNTTGSGFASIQSQVQSRINYMQVYIGSDNGTFFGVTRGGWAGNISESVSGMAFGTTTAADVIMGANNTATIRIFNATRNVVIQNGGTFTDAGYRLDVVGADSRFNGIRAGLGAGQVAGNTVFGDSALGSNVSGAKNTILGYQAGAVLTSNGNTFIGYQAGLVATTGNNILIGDRAGHTITTGADNTIIGTFSTSLVSGSGNVVLGSSVTLSTASNQNVSIGTFNVSTGDRNTLIGYGASSGGFNNSVVLGRQAAATANNQFVVGTATTNAGSVTTEVNASTQVWNVIINGTARKILLA